MKYQPGVSLASRSAEAATVPARSEFRRAFIGRGIRVIALTGRVHLREQTALGIYWIIAKIQSR